MASKQQSKPGTQGKQDPKTTGVNNTPGITGTAADPTADQGSPKATGHGGKVENDFNQTGEQKPTQRNEGQRTANSRSDRESHVGGSNQLQARRGSVANGGH